MLKEQSKLSKHNQGLFEFLSQIQFHIESDKDMLKQDIKSPTASRYRTLLENPKQGLINTYIDLDQIIADELLSKSVNEVINGDKAVKTARYHREGSLLNFFLVLKNDNEKNRDPYYEIAYKVIDSPLSDNFQITFNFMDSESIKEIDGDLIKE